MIEVTNLVKNYGAHTAVKSATFTINDGEVVGFLGPNGAGKSTTMNILTGYLSATSGTAKINGFDILEDPIAAKRHIGFLPEQPPLYLDMTVKEYLDFVYDLKKTSLPRKPHLGEICSLVKIDNVYNRLIRNLSKGYRQRVGIAQALIGNPDVLILDEPTVGLDPQQIIEIRNLISQLGRNHTIILSSHILSEIQAVCKRIIIINQGYIIADGSAEELSESISDDYSVITQIIGPPREVKAMLESIPGVRSVTLTGFFGRATQYQILPKAGTDVRRIIFERVAAKHWVLLELATKRLSLEEIFLEMVNTPPEKLYEKFNERHGIENGEPQEQNQTDLTDETENQTDLTQDDNQTDLLTQDQEQETPDSIEKEEDEQ